MLRLKGTCLFLFHCGRVTLSWVQAPSPMVLKRYIRLMPEAKRHSGLFRQYVGCAKTQWTSAISCTFLQEFGQIGNGRRHWESNLDISITSLSCSPLGFSRQRCMWKGLLISDQFCWKVKHEKLTVLTVPQRRLVVIFLMLYLARNINWDFPEENVHRVNNLQNLLIEAIIGI